MGGQSEEESATDYDPFSDDQEYELRKSTAYQRQRDETHQIIRDRHIRASNEIRGRHRPIRLSNKKQYWTLFFCRCCAKKQARNLYTYGYTALENDLDMIRLIKTNKNLTTLARCTYLTNSKRYEHLCHARDNVIDLDSQ